MAEKLALEEAFGEGRAVHRDEPAPGALGVPVDRPGHQLLAGSGLSQEQDTGLGRRDPGYRLHDFDDRQTVAYELRSATASIGRTRRSAAALPARGRQPATAQRPRERLAQGRDVVGLAHEIVGTCPDGFASGGCVAESREHQNQRVRLAFANGLEQVEPAPLRHPQVGEDRVERSLPLQLRERFLYRQRRRNVITIPLQDLGQQAAGGLVVVYQEDVGLLGARIPAVMKSRRRWAT